MPRPLEWHEDSKTVGGKAEKSSVNEAKWHLAKKRTSTRQGGNKNTLDPSKSTEGVTFGGVFGGFSCAQPFKYINNCCEYDIW